ncbi:piggyBac transposable element-derived protein 4-like [Schistocerca serialis cubense]|uniref:piggyBac transposable element-derived protein 4-like n=1 Tax=Schistocerca serialis cubense TaxID=2023355 RepID=UPI00214E46DD|nr:piggyBac transposable element-derived protein 4-like [Schistocerca serialis cubense]
MSRDRIFAIFRMLHVKNNALWIPQQESGHDPLHKIRPVWDFFAERCRKVFYPSQNLSVDEAICLFQGRIGFRVYMKDKPDKYGIKLYVLSDAQICYMCSVEVYNGGKGNVDNSIKSLLLRLCSSNLGKKDLYTWTDFIQVLQPLKTMGKKDIGSWNSDEEQYRFA